MKEGKHTCPAQAWGAQGFMKPCLQEHTHVTCRAPFMRRHGARTPLTDRYWDGATWQTGPDCGQQYEAVRVAVRDIRGGLQPASPHDASQVEQCVHAQQA